MREGEVEAFLYAQLARQRQQSVDAVHARVGSGGEIDSLEGLELTLAIDEQYGVRLGDDELTSSLLRSIPRLARRIARTLSTTTKE